MKKVFIVHGFDGSPNGGWRAWLMSELKKLDVYACALPMPTPEKPIRSEWVKEIARVVEMNKKDELYLIGHSLGVPAILHCLQQTKTKNIKGAIFAAGVITQNGKKNKISNFFDKPFNFKTIQAKSKQFVVIHGDNDPIVPFEQGQTLAREVKGKLIAVKNGGHLNGSSGWNTLPVCLKELTEMMNLGDLPTIK